MPNREAEVVWLTEERVFGYLVDGLQAHMSRVQYTKNGLSFDIMVENNEFELMEEDDEYDDDE